MTIKELKIIIDGYVKQIDEGEADDLDVVIANNKPSYGTTSHTKVKCLRFGFDWDDGLLFIVPENKMKEI